MDKLAGLEKRQKTAASLLNTMPNLTKLPPRIFRPLFRLTDRMLGLPKVAMADVKDHRVPLSTSNKRIKVRIYKPELETHGTLVYFHGGGCVVGDIDTHDRFCRYLAHFGQMNVASVDYRCGPEAKFPGAVCDAIDAWNWIHDLADELELDTNNIGVAGDSAGAYLSALIGLKKEQERLPVQSQAKPDFQMLLYPMMDLRGNTESYLMYDSGLILTNELMDYFTRHYLQNLDQANDSLASPVLAEDLSESPKTYILTLKFDPLRDAGLAYAERLKAAGVEVIHDHFDDCMHSFISVARLSQRAKQATHIVCTALKTISS